MRRSSALKAPLGRVCSMWSYAAPVQEHPAHQPEIREGVLRMSYRAYSSGVEHKSGRYPDRDMCTSPTTADKPDVVGEVGVLHLFKEHALDYSCFMACS